MSLLDYARIYSTTLTGNEIYNIGTTNRTKVAPHAPDGFANFKHYTITTNRVVTRIEVQP